MAKKTTLEQMGSRDFDLEFWAKVGAEGRFEAAWDMVCDLNRWKGKNASQPRLQRSVASLKQRKY